MKNPPATAAPDFVLEAEPPAPARKRAVKKTAAKAVRKKAAAVSPVAEDSAPEAVPAPAVEAESAPAVKKTTARKTAAKKTARKTARKAAVVVEDETAAAPEVEPSPPAVTAEEAPARKTVAKKAARKTARKTAAAKGGAGSGVEETPAVPEKIEVPAETPPAVQTEKTEAAPPVSDGAQAFAPEPPAAERPAPSAGEEASGVAVRGHFPRHARPERPPVPAPQHYQPPPRQPGEGGFHEPPDTVMGPDGQPRRLTKWERWKLRKEKIKLLRQQRFLERQAAREGGPGAPGPEGAAAPPHAAPHAPQGFRERPQRPEPPPLGPPEEVAGLLEMMPKGFAFLRPPGRNFAAVPTDPFVSPEMIRQFGLREGVWVEGVHRRSPRGSQVTEIKTVNGLEPDAYRTLPLFEELTAINPNKRYVLETTPTRYTTRIIDFIAPIGRGQRGLIVAPPRAGKTTFLQHIAEAVLENYKGVKVIVLLVDERPEEVTEIARALPGAEIMASSNDQDPRNHIRMAELAVARAKRLVEAGEHVFMLLDSITRLARGFNNSMRGGGKAMSGGIDSRALEAPRRLFAAARNTREAGSLTIIATALVETNNKGDDLIFQEFKGTGNMELVLDRKIAQQYVYPAVDIFKSGTRREELLLPPHQLEKVHLIRRGLAGHRPVEAMERLLQFMQRFPNNAQMLIEIKSRE